MTKLKFTVIAVMAALTLSSCGGGSGSQPADAKGFGEIEKEIKAKFGDDAYYTELSVMYDETIGNMISTTVTKDPESLKMEEWSLSQDAWNLTSEITLEVPEGTKAADYMFQLNEKINLSDLGGLVEKSMKQLTEEKNIENPKLAMAYVSYPDNGDASKAQYNINLEPENGGTTFHFSYTLEGELIDMSY